MASITRIDRTTAQSSGPRNTRTTRKNHGSACSVHLHPNHVSFEQGSPISRAGRSRWLDLAFGHWRLGFVRALATCHLPLRLRPSRSRCFVGNHRPSSSIDTDSMRRGHRRRRRGGLWGMEEKRQRDRGGRRRDQRDHEQALEIRDAVHRVDFLNQPRAN